jgi:hypothetical protein
MSLVEDVPSGTEKPAVTTLVQRWADELMVRIVEKRAVIVMLKKTVFMAIMVYAL